MAIPLNPVSKTPKTPYQIKRDALIPEAMAHVDIVVCKRIDGTEWNLAFFEEMDRLAREKGLVTHSEDGYRREAETREIENERLAALDRQ